MASENSSLESNGSNESISNSYVNNERHNASQIQSIPHQIDYEVLTANQCYEKQNYSVKGHGHSMSGNYEPLQYDVINKQTNESLKQQCEKALHDLNQLRRQHTETSRRCEHVMKELEYFRGQHRAAMNQLEVSAQEASSLRGKYGDLLNDNQRLEREVQRLQQSSNPEGSSDALVHTLRKYESLKEEFDCFQKRYDDLIENHNATLEKLRSVQDENSRLKTQCHELTQERNAVIRERNALKQQVASVVRQWEGGVRERADIKRLTDERNAAMAEYTLIMSERDTVHKEMEKLSDDLQAALKRVAALEAALQASRDEQRATALQVPDSDSARVPTSKSDSQFPRSTLAELQVPDSDSARVPTSKSDSQFPRSTLAELQVPRLGLRTSSNFKVRLTVPSLDASRAAGAPTRTPHEFQLQNSQFPRSTLAELQVPDSDSARVPPTSKSDSQFPRSTLAELQVPRLGLRTSSNFKVRLTVPSLDASRAAGAPTRTPHEFQLQNSQFPRSTLAELQVPDSDSARVPTSKSDSQFPRSTLAELQVPRLGLRTSSNFKVRLTVPSLDASRAAGAPTRTPHEFQLQNSQFPRSTLAELQVPRLGLRTSSNFKVRLTVPSLDASRAAGAPTRTPHEFQLQNSQFPRSTLAELQVPRLGLRTSSNFKVRLTVPSLDASRAAGAPTRTPHEFQLQNSQFPCSTLAELQVPRLGLRTSSNFKVRLTVPLLDASRAAGAPTRTPHEFQLQNSQFPRSTLAELQVPRLGLRTSSNFKVRLTAPSLDASRAAGAPTRTPHEFQLQNSQFPRSTLAELQVPRLGLRTSSNFKVRLTVPSLDASRAAGAPTRTPHEFQLQNSQFPRSTLAELQVPRLGLRTSSNFKVRLTVPSLDASRAAGAPTRTPHEFQLQNSQFPCSTLAELQVPRLGLRTSSNFKVRLTVPSLDASRAAGAPTRTPHEFQLQSQTHSSLARR
ncbi:unnamed protein product, partial [Iphiclides podalirius]